MIQSSDTNAQYPSLRGKSVFITGGGTGIGEVMVEQFSAQGAKVCFVDVNREKSQALVERVSQRYGADVLFIECDIRDIACLERAIARSSRFRQLCLRVW